MIGVLLGLAQLAAASPKVVVVSSAILWSEAKPCCSEIVTERLEHSGNDAWRAAHVLGGFTEPAQVRVLSAWLPDPPAAASWAPLAPDAITLERLERTLDELGIQGDRPSELILYISGHGTAGQFHFDGGMVPQDALYEMLARRLGKGSRLLMVLDLCNSSAGIQTRAMGDGSAELVRMRLRRKRVAPPTLVKWTDAETMMVSVQGSSLQLDAPLKGSILTYTALSALVGGGDGFKNRSEFRSREGRVG